MGHRHRGRCLRLSAADKVPYEDADLRYESKKAPVTDICTGHGALCDLLREIPQDRHKERGVWGDEWAISDLVAHLAEWQRMFLRWYDEGLKGMRPRMPAPDYKVERASQAEPADPAKAQQPWSG